jgi:predicted transcriptional regulator
MPAHGLVMVRLLLLQANACVHQLPPASTNAPDRKDDYTSQVHENIFAQYPLARSSITTLHGRLHVHGPLTRNNTTPTRPRRGVANRSRLHRNPKKGMWEATQVGDHLNLTIDLQKGEF